jgi:hypothetical protein
MNSTVIEKRLYSLSDASARLGNISTFSLRRHIETGALKSVRIGSRIFLSVTELERVERDGVRPRRHGER